MEIFVKQNTKSLLPMTVITKEGLKSYPNPDWSADFPRIADLYEKGHCL